MSFLLIKNPAGAGSQLASKGPDVGRSTSSLISARYRVIGRDRQRWLDAGRIGMDGNQIVLVVDAEILIECLVRSITGGRAGEFGGDRSCHVYLKRKGRPEERPVQARANYQNHPFGSLQRGYSSLGGGTVVQFPRIWMSSGKCRLGG